MLGYKRGLEGRLELLSQDDIVTNYYLRMEVDDRSGVLAQITDILGQFDISIESIAPEATTGRKGRVKTSIYKS